MKAYRFLLVSLFTIAGFGLPLLADVIKLKNGTTIEAPIVSETDTEVVIEKRYGGGSIISKDVIKKADIAEIVRATAEEKAKLAVQQAYETTTRYKLEPNRSFTVDYYDKVIEGSFRKFLADYPDAPQAQAIAEKILAWQAEREQVAKGKVKYQGAWMDAEEVARLEGEQQSEKLLQEATALMNAARYAEANQRLEKLLSLTIPSDIAEVARRTRTDCWQKWNLQLLEQQKKLETDIPACDQRMEELKKIIADAQAAVRSTQGSGFKTSTTTGSSRMNPRDSRTGRDRMSSPNTGTTTMGPRMGTSGTADAINTLGAAQSEMVQLQTRCPQLRTELQAVKQTLASLNNRASDTGIQLASGATNTNQAAAAAATAASAAAEEEKDILTQMAEVAKKYWMWGLGVLVLLIWFVTKRLGQ